MPILIDKQINQSCVENLKKAVQAKESISGLTHNFYRYPARFSPKFVREFINCFSSPGDVVLDPFVGGGTTLVEALASNRHSIGFDVSPIASFVSTAKTTMLSEEEILGVQNWAQYVLQKKIKSHQSSNTFYDQEGYLNNLPWRIKKQVEVIMDDIPMLKTQEKQRFAKCVLLKTAQWAVDATNVIPTVSDFRNKFLQNLNTCSNGLNELSSITLKNSQQNSLPICLCINDSSEKIADYPELNSLPEKPKLVITSPPYIGINILYHQWQVNGRKRTRTPFWIIDSLDGQGSGHYTFGYHQSHAKKTYFEIAQRVFTSIHTFIHNDGIVVQLVGFSNPRKYLARYLEMMHEAGYEEVPIARDKLNRIKRIWRDVPNRKWYNRTKSRAQSSKEVLLIHRKK